MEGDNDWLSVRNSKRRFFAITLSSTGARIPLPPSLASITQLSIGCCLRRACPRPSVRARPRSLIPTYPSLSRRWINTPRSRPRGCMRWHSNAATRVDPVIFVRMWRNCVRANRAKRMVSTFGCTVQRVGSRINGAAIRTIDVTAVAVTTDNDLAVATRALKHPGTGVHRHVRPMRAGV